MPQPAAAPSNGKRSTAEWVQAVWPVLVALLTASGWVMYLVGNSGAQLISLERRIGELEHWREQEQKIDTDTANRVANTERAIDGIQTQNGAQERRINVLNELWQKADDRLWQERETWIEDLRAERGRLNQQLDNRTTPKIKGE